MTITEKVAYIKGLMAGMKLDTENGDGKVLAEIVDLLGEIAADMTEAHAQIDAVDDDLSGLEEFVYEDMDGSFDLDDDFCPGDCTDCDGCEDFAFADDDDEDSYDEDDAEYSVTCPSCGAEFFIDETALDSDEVFECPGCGQKIEFYVEEDEEDGDAE